MVDPDKPSKCKVGITKDPTQRIKAYRTAAPNCYFSNVYSDVEHKHEKRILDILKDIFKVQSEYVHAEPRIVQNIVEGYFNDISENNE